MLTACENASGTQQQSIYTNIYVPLPFTEITENHHIQDGCFYLYLYSIQSSLEKTLFLPQHDYKCNNKKGITSCCVQVAAPKLQFLQDYEKTPGFYVPIVVHTE